MKFHFDFTTFLKMRRLIPTLLMLFALLTARAQSINVYYQFQDYTTNAAAVNRVSLTPIPFPPGVTPQSILVPTAFSTVTDTSGSCTFSNVITGFAYKVSLVDRLGNVLSLTNFFGTNLTGTVNGNTTLGVWAGPFFAYFMSTNFTRLTNYTTILQTNVSLVTNSTLVLSTNYTLLTNAVTINTTNTTRLTNSTLVLQTNISLLTNSFTVNFTNKVYATNIYWVTNTTLLTNSVTVLQTNKTYTTNSTITIQT